ncbi:MAG TPA: hypothetical protein VII87_01790 [Solirubrobacteraceae bacterium]
MRSCGPVLLATGLVALALSACGGSSSASSTPTTSAAASSSTTTATSASPTSTTPASSQAQISYEGIPIESGPEIAPASTTQTGTVDGIRCGATEQLAYHVHAHLAVFVNGRIYSLPAGIGIPGSTAQQTSQGPVAAGGQCIYWLHTHTSDGIIHIESPTQRIYTLGNFFDEWHQRLTAKQVGTVHGTITAYLDGHLWKKNLRDIPLLPHALIQLNIGEPAAPQLTVNWSQTGL